MIDQLVALHDICLLTVHMPLPLVKEMGMIPFRTYISNSPQQQLKESGTSQQDAMPLVVPQLTKTLCAELCNISL